MFREEIISILSTCFNQLQDTYMYMGKLPIIYYEYSNCFNSSIKTTNNNEKQIGPINPAELYNCSLTL